MKTLLTTSVIGALLCSTMVLAESKLVQTESEYMGALAGPQDKLNEARANAKALGGALKMRLKAAIAQGGLEAGVEECYVAAGPIADALSQEGWTVGRTALRARNQDNKPDTWEESQLRVITEALSKQLPMPLEASQWNEESGELRYMSAILTGQVCTACHGNQISPSVTKIINEKYPLDAATGFEVGSLRGAFTLTYSGQ